MKKIFLLIVFILLLLSNRAISQDVYGLWTGVEFTKPLSNSLSVSVSPELRTTTSPFVVDDILLEANIAFKPLKWLQIVGGYRYSKFYESDFDDRFNGHRYSVAIRPKLDLGRFSFTYRGQYQRSMVYWYDMGYSIETKDNFRNRLQVAYDIPNAKVEPFVMGELYYDLTSGKQKEFSRLRVRAGVTYPLNKRNEIEFFGQYQSKLNSSTPETSYVLGAFYSFSFRKSKPAATENVVVDEN
ncbi:MAG TPA: DUF2490 domain-containing protein [Tenuifilaceae bacterium]|nr:DUF2490 domain-containing protein [Tenuifilaceae bacterium]